ncbi:MAG: PD-(D/E)XK nuclease family protein [Candidatus Omnitrophota bacterium]|nr:PD-(D/E)XK nuclease family protein [Candidatus Omnitrophota bacterium]
MFRISPTTGLNLFKGCPRCFWLHYNRKIARPRGIFPSLPGGMDLVIKEYFNAYRGKLPPELEGKIKGKLMPDLALLEKWRNWRTGLEYCDKALDAVLFGALDDCLVEGDLYIPLDYKTKGSAPNDGDSEKYYQTQLDSYAFLLSANGYRTADFAYLVYYYPAKVEKDGMVKFNIKACEIGTSITRIKKLFSEAVEVLKGAIPKAAYTCEYCSWHNSRLSAEDKYFGKSLI